MRQLILIGALALSTQNLSALQCGDLKAGTIAGSVVTAAMTSGTMLYQIHVAKKIARDYSVPLLRAEPGVVALAENVRLPVAKGDRLTATLALSPEESRAVYLQSLQNTKQSDFMSAGFFGADAIESVSGGFNQSAIVDSLFVASSLLDAKNISDTQNAIRSGQQLAPQQYVTVTYSVFDEVDARSWITQIQQNGRTLSNLFQLPAEQVNLIGAAKGLAITTGVLAAGALLVATEEALAGKISARLEQRLIDHACP